MSDISRLAEALSGKITNIDISANTLVTTSIKVGGGVSNTELTKTILDRLVSLQNGSDVNTTYHTHDTVYYRQSTLNSATIGAAGSTLIGDDNSYSNFTPTAATVKGALQGIDTALTGSGSTQKDGTFQIENTSDPTKIMKFDASGITTGNTRTLKMADANVDLANLTDSNISPSAAIAYTKLATLGGVTNDVLIQSASGYVTASGILSTNLFLADGSVSATGNFNLNGHKLTSLSAGTTAGDSVRYEQAILISGVNAWTANQSLGGNLITNSGTPINPQDLANKAYIDNLVQGLNWKTTVRSATTAVLPGTYAYNNGTAGVGATITQNGTISGNALNPQDGVTLVVGNRLLVKNETGGNQPYNGIYTVTQVGDGATVPYILTRATDSDTAAKLQWATVEVSPDASTQPGYIYRESDDITTIGTDNVAFSLISQGLAYIFTSGVQLIGNTVSAHVDNSTIDVNGSNQIEVKAGGITNTQVSASAGITYSKLSLTNSIVNADIAAAAGIVYSKLTLTNSIVLGDLTSNSVDENKIVSTTFSASGAITGGSGTKVAWNPDNSSLEINSNAARIKTTAYDQATITGGGGSAAAVQYAPSQKLVAVAGQTFSANTSYAVRWGLTANGETAGRIYAADPDTSSFDLFYVIGMISGGAGLTAGSSVTVTKLGLFNLSSSDSAFASNTDGKAVFLTSGGAFSTTAPSTAGQAITRIGIIQLRSATPASNVIDVSPAVVGVN